MTTIALVNIRCESCGWTPKRKYHQVLSTSSFCVEPGRPVTPREYSVPRICSKCGSSALLQTSVNPFAAGGKHDELSFNETNLEDIPAFLRRSLNDE